MAHRLVQREPLDSLIGVNLETLLVTSKGEPSPLSSKAESELSLVCDIRTLQDIKDRLNSISAGGRETKDAICFLCVEKICLVCDTTKLISELCILLNWGSEVETVLSPEAMVRGAFAVGLAKLT